MFTITKEVFAKLYDLTAQTGAYELCGYLEGSGAGAGSVIDEVVVNAEGGEADCDTDDHACTWHSHTVLPSNMVMFPSPADVLGAVYDSVHNASGYGNGSKNPSNLFDVMVSPGGAVIYWSQKLPVHGERSAYAKGARDKPALNAAIYRAFSGVLSGASSKNLPVNVLNPHVFYYPYGRPASPEEWGEVFRSKRVDIDASVESFFSSLRAAGIRVQFYPWDTVLERGAAVFLA